MAQNGFCDRRSRPFRINVVITLAVRERHRRNFILPLPDFSLGRCRNHSDKRPRPIIGAALGQQRPGYARHLVGKRYRHDLEGSSRQQLREPGILLWLLARTLQHRMGSDHERYAPHVAVALFRDRPELLLAAGRVLARHEPIQAAKSRPERNAIGSATVATMADAPTMPIPGMLLSRLLASFERCSPMAGRAL